MIIRKLDYEAYKGLKYQAEIVSDRYLSIEPAGEGFDIGWVMSDEPIRMSVNDAMLSDWLDHPTAYIPPKAAGWKKQSHMSGTRNPMRKHTSRMAGAACRTIQAKTAFGHLP